MRKLILSLLVTAFAVGNIAAQSILTKDIKMTKKLGIFKVGGNDSRKLDPEKNSATLEAWIFPDGHKTYTVKISGEISQAAGQGDSFQLSWSGNENKINMANAGNNGEDIYLVMDSQGQMDALFAPQSDGTVSVVFTGNIDRIQEISNGMTVEELTESLKKAVGNMLTLKPVGNVGTLKKYTAYTFGMRDNYDNSVSVTKDTPYGHFFFNSQGKLVKWYIQ